MSGFFSIMHRYAAVKTAKDWKNVGEEISFESARISVRTSIPDYSPLSGAVSTMEIFENIHLFLLLSLTVLFNAFLYIILEHVEIAFTATHKRRTDLRSSVSLLFVMSIFIYY